MQPILYTIGHGTRKAEEFWDLLKQNQIKVLVDVRTLPYSRFNPQYNQKALQQNLQTIGIEYVFMGDFLGGRPKNEAYYTNGKINYDLLSETDFFKRGLKELIEKYASKSKTAIVCSERKPEDCHRSKLIGKELIKQNVTVLHIDEKEMLRDQQSLGLNL